MRRLINNLGHLKLLVLDLYTHNILNRFSDVTGIAFSWGEQGEPYEKGIHRKRSISFIFFNGSGQPAGRVKAP
jgi:hypothetical protein